MTKLHAKLSISNVRINSFVYPEFKGADAVTYAYARLRDTCVMRFARRRSWHVRTIPRLTVVIESPFFRYRYYLNSKPVLTSTHLYINVTWVHSISYWHIKLNDKIACRSCNLFTFSIGSLHYFLKQLYWIFAINSNHLFIFYSFGSKLNLAAVK